MRGTLRVIGLISLLSIVASCARLPMLASAGDMVPRPTATDAVTVSPLIEMPPLFVDARQMYAQVIKRASADVTGLCARELNCPAVRVRRADHYLRADGTPWTVVRVTACGQERVYEKVHGQWSDATWRLR